MVVVRVIVRISMFVFVVYNENNLKPKLMKTFEQLLIALVYDPWFGTIMNIDCLMALLNYLCDFLMSPRLNTYLYSLPKFLFDLVFCLYLLTYLVFSESPICKWGYKQNKIYSLPGNVLIKLYKLNLSSNTVTSEITSVPIFYPEATARKIYV